MSCTEAAWRGGIAGSYWCARRGGTEVLGGEGSGAVRVLTGAYWCGACAPLCCALRAVRAGRWRCCTARCAPV
eukprot:scaffold6856_cov124-Isochrysis_galbana.AAC.2